MLDVKSAVCGLEKMLKTGIVAASWESNVQSSTSSASRQLLSPQQSPAANSGEADDILDVAVRRLKSTVFQKDPARQTRTLQAWQWWGDLLLELCARTSVRIVSH
ncbi:hypothetical protein HPB50_013696 [Hyalomma asiaticum]|uniref:Uncharacterized protein n=1 Tax=Hyalomma asiaticum TaxID=266040 RepID=A0ACB7RUK1_HYAAI|nr:hypothetical protein HPB50_013696 [Hyalomma asiaticum]